MKWLHANNYDVLEVKNRQHIDLRVPGALDQFHKDQVSFVIFLACEVGGSKFLASNSAQQLIVENNVLIYQVVFKWLHSRNIPYLFASSYLQSYPTPYGSVKRLGEAWMEAMPKNDRDLPPLGKAMRFWNVYGSEDITEKSHVIADWVAACAKTGHIGSLTTGEEYRQFLHVDDCAAYIGLMMNMHDELDAVTDITSGQWVQMKDVAAIIAQKAPLGDWHCCFSF